MNMIQRSADSIPFDEFLTAYQDHKFVVTISTYENIIVADLRRVWCELNKTLFTFEDSYDVRIAEKLRGSKIVTPFKKTEPVLLPLSLDGIIRFVHPIGNSAFAFAIEEMDAGQVHGFCCHGFLEPRAA